jgi:hypothetical protein
VVRTDVSEERIASIFRNMSMSSLAIEEYYVRFEVFTAMYMKKIVFWDLVSCSCAVKTSNLTKD